MNQSLLALCRDRLKDFAQAGKTISYSDVAAHLCVANQSFRPYLIAIYRDNTDADLIGSRTQVQRPTTFC